MFIFFNNPIVKKCLLGLIVIAMIAITYIFHTRTTSQYIERIKQIEYIHQEELRKINSALDKERKQHEVNIIKLQAELLETSKKYKESLEILGKKKAVNTNTLIQKYSGDTTGMAKRIAHITGFNVVMP